MKRLKAILAAVAVSALAVTTTGTHTSMARSVGANHVTLNFATWTVVQGKWPDAVISNFEKANPNITINFVGVPVDPSAITQAERVKFLAGDGLDIAAIRPEALTSFIKAGYLADLTTSGLVNGQRYIPNALTAATVKGHVYAVPGSADAIGVWYNKDLFATLHLSVPTTWSQFLTVMAKIKASGTSPLVNGFRDGWPVEFDSYPFIQALQVKTPRIFENLDAGTVKYTDPRVVQTFSDINTFFKKGYSDPASLSLSFPQAANVFLQRKAAMMIQGEWLAGVLVNPSFHLGVFPMPLPGLGSTHVVPVTIGDYLAIAASTPHKAEALKFLKFWYQQQNQTTLVNVLQHFSPLRSSQIPQSSILHLFTPLLALPNNNFFYSIQTPGVNAVMLKDLQSLYLGQIAPHQIAADLQNAQNRAGGA